MPVRASVSARLMICSRAERLPIKRESCDEKVVQLRLHDDVSGLERNRNQRLQRLADALDEIVGDQRLAAVARRDVEVEILFDEDGDADVELDAAREGGESVIEKNL